MRQDLGNVDTLRISKRIQEPELIRDQFYSSRQTLTKIKHCINSFWKYFKRKCKKKKFQTIKILLAGNINPFH